VTRNIVRELANRLRLKRRSTVTLSALVLVLTSIIMLDTPFRKALSFLGISLEQTAIAAPSYDVFLATLGTVVLGLVILYFTAAGAELAFLVGDSRKRAFDSFFQTWWIVPPVFLVFLTFAMLALSPYRIRPYMAALPVLITLLIAALFAFMALARLLRSEVHR
jgi:hypothetical protein